MFTQLFGHRTYTTRTRLQRGKSFYVLSVAAVSGHDLEELLTEANWGRDHALTTALVWLGLLHGSAAATTRPMRAPNTFHWPSTGHTIHRIPLCW